MRQDTDVAGLGQRIHEPRELYLVVGDIIGGTLQGVIGQVEIISARQSEHTWTLT